MKHLLHLASCLCAAAQLAVSAPVAARERGPHGAETACERKGAGGHGFTADDAAEQARRMTGGRVLAVQPDVRDGRTGYRVKVLTPGGEVRQVFVGPDGGRGRRD
jgi:hypothetical protein